MPAVTWTRPQWLLAALLAALSMLGPFAVDTYLPAFGGMRDSFGATPAQLQQTLSIYLGGFAITVPFLGALSDSFGRRRVILVGMVIFTLASAGAALSESFGTFLLFRLLQGMSAGTGMVVGRAFLRDLYQDHTAQRVMSLSTIFFGVAPALAPVIGGLFYAWMGWRSIFWFLAAAGGLLFLVVITMMPETLLRAQRRPFNFTDLLRGYRDIGRSRRFWLLALCAGVPFNAVFLFVVSVPAMLPEQFGFQPSEFWKFMLFPIGGIVGGAAVSGRLAGRIPHHRQMTFGYAIMAGACAISVAAALAAPPVYPWSCIPITLFAIGWSMVTPAVTLMVLDLFPHRRGMASSLQTFVFSLFNALSTGLVSPLVMHSWLLLCLGAAAMLVIGYLAWRGSIAD